MEKIWELSATMLPPFQPVGNLQVVRFPNHL